MTSFSLEPYKGWSEDALRRRCIQLVRIVMKKDVMIAVMAKYGLDALNEDDKKEVERICSQWED